MSAAGGAGGADGVRPARLVLVVGTGTEIGKTWVSAALCSRLAARGVRVAARKLAQSYEADLTGAPVEPTDAEVLGRATGEDASTVTPANRWYPVPMAPPMAAAVLGHDPLLLSDLVAELDWGPGAPEAGILETAGGVRSPQADDGDAVDLAGLVRPDLSVLVADAGLGTINSVRLSVDAFGGRAGPVVVVLNRFDTGERLHVDNARWLADRDGLDVITVEGGAGGEWANLLADRVIGFDTERSS